MPKHKSSIVRINKNGQLTIPKQVRERYGFSDGDYLMMVPNENALTLEKARITTKGTQNHGTRTAS